MTGDFSNLSFDIDNQTVLVAGAAGGIGSVVSQMLAKHGARLILLDRDAKRLDDLKSRVQGEQQFLHLDICDSEATQELFPRTCNTDVVDVWADFIVNHKWKLKSPMPPTFFKSICDKSELDRQIMAAKDKSLQVNMNFH